MHELISQMNCKGQSCNEYNFLCNVERRRYILCMSSTVLQRLTIEVLKSMFSKIEVHNRKELRNIFFENS